MSSKQALTLVEQVLSENGVSSLNHLQTSIFRQAWENHTYQEIALSLGYDVSYIKQVGSDLWQQLSNKLGEKVTKRNLQQVLGGKLEENLRWKSASTQFVSRQDWGEASDASIFYGRSEELACLQDWILNDSCRLVGVFGMGGIGKTTLSVKLAQEIQDRFEVVIWRSLRNVPPLNCLLQDLLQVLSSSQSVEKALASDFDSLLRSLLDLLRQHRSLIVLDNIETIMQPWDTMGTYKQGYEGYAQLFYSLGDTRHESTIVLTSREKPKEIACQEGSELPVRSLRLQGLPPQIGRSLFEVKGSFTGAAKHWQHLINHYAGNPLALKMLAPVIQDFFNGQLAPFIEILNQGKSVFGDIRDLLSCQIERLSYLEQQVMVWLAIYREPISLSQLRFGFMETINLGDLLEAVTALERRSLIERDIKYFNSESSPRFTLQPVVMEYMTDWLVDQVTKAIQSSVVPENSLLHTHPLILAQAKDYIREIQTQLILQPISRQLLLRDQQDTLATHLKHHLTSWREQGISSYASGNVINLVQQLQISLHGWNFSYLTIWQAYLQDTTLQQANFAYADLSQSVFKETFSQVLCVAFSPDGQLLAASDVSYEIHIWRVADSQPLLTLRAQDGWCWSVTISPDNQTLASSANGTVNLWDIRTGEYYGQIQGSSSRVFSLAFSPDGQFLASGGEDHQVRVWCTRDRRFIHCFSGHTDEVKSVAFAPNGYKSGVGMTNHLLASGGYDGTIRLWNLVTGDSTLIDTEVPVWSIAFSSNGQTLASGHSDGLVRIWDLSTQKQLRSLFGHTQQVRSVGFRPDGCLLASGSDDCSIHLWNWQTGELKWILRGHQSWISNVVFSPDGRTLASSSEDQSVRLWDTQKKQPLKVLRGHNSGVWAVALHPHQHYLVSGGQDRRVRLWPLTDQATGQELTGNEGWVLAVAVSPNGQWIASGGEDSSLHLWNSQTGKLIATWREHTHEVWAVAFCPDRDLLVSGSLDGTIRLWSPSEQTCQGILRGHHSGVWTLAVSPDGKRIASGSQDQTVRIWDVERRICIQSLPCEGSWVRGLAFSPDGRFLCSGGSNGYIMVWDLKLGHRTVIGSHSSLVLSVAFSSDGQWLASCSGDTTIKLWSLKTWQCDQTLSGHDKWVRYVTFSADDHRLISCSQDETIQIWVRTATCEHSIYCLEQTLRMPRPYEGMNITGVTGLTKAQKIALTALGAVESVNMKIKMNQF